ARKLCEGTPITSTSAPATASPRSAVARSAGGSLMPGRYLRFSRSRLMPSTVSASRAHRVIGALRDTSDATVVPQLPPPSSPTFRRMCLSPPLFRKRVARFSRRGKKVPHHRGGLLWILDHRNVADMLEDIAASTTRFVFVLLD